MKKFISLLLSILLLISLGACESKSNDFNDNPVEVVCVPKYPKGYSSHDCDTRMKVFDDNPVEDEFCNSINNFSYSTASQLLKDKNENIMYSPLSLYYALAIATDGSEGETQTQLLKLLDISDKDYLSKQCSNLYRLLYKDNEYSKLKIANSLWLDNEFDGNKLKFKNNFLDNARDNFYASLFSVDFSSDKTGIAMEKWISDNTNGTLEYDFSPDPSQIMSIINTVYFYDEWTDKFDENETKQDTFNISDKEQIQCDFMNIDFGSSGYTKGNGYLKSALGLKNDTGMIFILPDKGVSVNELLSSPEKINEIFNGGENKCGEVKWKIPKFSYGTSLNIKDSLEALGVNYPFGFDANFKGISDANPFISDIKQKTHIAIDEKGVEASAYTELEYDGCALPEGKAEMILNRPFIFGITTYQGNLLFIGVCNNPLKN